MALKFYTSEAKGLKLKVLGTNIYVCRSYRKKTSKKSPILNRVQVHLNGHYLRKSSILNRVKVYLNGHYLRKKGTKNGKWMQQNAANNLGKNINRGVSQISVITFFCKNSQQLKAANFRSIIDFRRDRKYTSNEIPFSLLAPIQKN